MKKSICYLIIGLIFMITGTPLYSQDQPAVSPEKNVLKVNTLALVIATGSVFYERKISDLISGQLGVGYLNYKINDAKFSGLILTPEMRLYVKKNAIDGFYVAPYVRYQKYSFDGTDSEGSLTSVGGGAALGMQWIFPKGFVMDMFFGGHYTNADANLTIGTEAPGITTFDGFHIRVGFMLGFAF